MEGMEKVRKGQHPIPKYSYLVGLSLKGWLQSNWSSLIVQHY